MKKLLLILTLTALLTLLIACTGEVTTAVTTTDTPGTVTTPTENTTTEAAVKDTTEITTAEITTEDSNVLYKDLKNPIYPTGNDPWIVEHNGKYYSQRDGQ